MTDLNSVLKTNNTTGFTGYHLKMIALITMLIDHIAAVVIWRVYVASYATSNISINQEAVYSVYQMMRYIGRMAFPIYCFLLVYILLSPKYKRKYFTLFRIC